MTDPNTARAIAKAVVEGCGDAALRRLDAGARRRSPTGSLLLRVAVAPQGADLSRECEIAKTALLYGDSVELVSPAAAMLFVVKSLRRLSPDERLTLFGPISSVLGKDQSETLEQLRALFHLPHPSGRSLIVKRKLQREFDEQWEELSSVGDQLWRDAGGSELDVAWEAGLLRFGMVREAVADFDHLADDFVADLHRTVEGTSEYPLFDDASGGLVGAALAAGAWSIPDLTSARVAEATLATGLVGQLPAYPKASMKGVIEARDALKDSLPGFRRAVRHLDAAASDPFDETFGDRVHDAYSKEVEPAFSDIRLELRRVEGSLLGVVANASPAPIVTSVVSFGHLALGSWSIVAGSKMLADRGSRVKAAKQNAFYLLYGANEYWS
jgi:hypothetical protein